MVGWLPLKIRALLMRVRSSLEYASLRRALQEQEGHPRSSGS